MQKSFALFDFDGTLRRGDSIVDFIRFARHKGVCGNAALLRVFGAVVCYGLRLTSFVKAKQMALGFLAGRTTAEIDALSRAFCRDVLLPTLRPQARSELQRHRAEGRDVLLVTASPSFYLQPLKAELGLTEIVGTRMDVGEDGRYTGLICGNNCNGVEKPLRLAEYLAATGERLDYEGSWAYGDSRNDLPMLRLCAHRVLVNPKRGVQPPEGAVTVRWNEPDEPEGR